MSTNHITHWIGGKPYGGVAERQGDVYDPATGLVTGKVDFATAADMDEAVAVAKEAFAEWRHSSLAKRTQVLFAFRELLNARKEDVAALITAEHGKVLSDALGEVTRGLEVVEFACGIPHLLKGGFSEGVSTKVDVYSIRQPLGRGRRHLAVQLPGHGAHVVLPDRHRRGEHRHRQAEREGPVRRQPHG